MKLLSSAAVAFVLGAAAMSTLNKNITDIGNQQMEYVKSVVPQTTTEETTEATTITVYNTANLSKNSRGWYFMYKNDHKTPSVQGGMDYKKYSAYYVGDTAEKKIYLTFDEGYENGYTSKILDILKEKDVKATFFCTGTYLKSQPELIKRMVSEGHIVGNHTYNHPNMVKISDDAIKKELNDCAYEYYKIIGKPMPKYVRPPEGTYSERSLAVSHNEGYKTIFWSFAYKDWDQSQQPSITTAYNKIINGSHNGAIYLLHAVSKSNTEVLGKCIDQLKSQGYTFGNLDELK